MTKPAIEIATELIDNAETEEHKFHGGKSLVVSYLLPNGNTVDGRAGIVDITKYNHDLGKQIARQDAIKQLTKIIAVSTGL